MGMEGNAISKEPSTLANWQPVYNRARGTLSSSSPHARNAALLCFLFSANATEGGEIQILTTDFHANTWHARFNEESLKSLQGGFGGGDFSCFLESLHDGLLSETVKVELGGPASAIGGEGATSAKLIVKVKIENESKDLSFDLNIWEGRCANDGKGALAMEIYEALVGEKQKTKLLQEQRTKLLQDSLAKQDKARRTKFFDGSSSLRRFLPAPVPERLATETMVADGAEGGRLPLSAVPVLPSKMVPEFRIMDRGFTGSSMDVGATTCEATFSKANRGGGSRRKRSYLVLSDAHNYGKKAARERALQGSAEKPADDSSSGLADGASLDAGRAQDGLAVVEYGNPLRLQPAAPPDRTQKYRDIDMSVLAKIDQGIESRSVSSDNWGRNHYREWRRDQGLPEVEIEDLPLSEFADSLVKFFCMVKKRNGELFPSESLKGMYRCFARILTSHQRKLALKGNHSGPVTDMSKDMLFEKARIACIEAMKYSIMNGANESKRKRNQPSSAPTEDEMLNHPANQVTHPHGIARRLCYYLIRRFAIHGHLELYDTTDIEFVRIGPDQRGVVAWEYNEGLAANFKAKTSFRPVVRIDEPDVVLCLDTYFSHLPEKELVHEPRRFFLSPIKNPSGSSWFRHQNIGARTLWVWYKHMAPVGSGQYKPSISKEAPSLLRNIAGVLADEDVQEPGLEPGLEPNLEPGLEEGPQQ